MGILKHSVLITWKEGMAPWFKDRFPSKGLTRACANQHPNFTLHAPGMLFEQRQVMPLNTYVTNQSSPSVWLRHMLEIHSQASFSLHFCQASATFLLYSRGYFLISVLWECFLNKIHQSVLWKRGLGVKLVTLASICRRDFHRLCLFIAQAWAALPHVTELPFESIQSSPLTHSIVSVFIT